MSEMMTSTRALPRASRLRSPVAQDPLAWLIDVYVGLSAC